MTYKLFDMLFLIDESECFMQNGFLNAPCALYSLPQEVVPF